MLSGSSDDQKSMKIQPWNKDPKTIAALAKNGLVIKPLDSKSIKSLNELIERNINDDGFIQMVNLKTKPNEILSGKNKDQCYVALSKWTGEVIGFVVFNAQKRLDNESMIGVIDLLGVDKNSRHDSESKITQRVGSALLLVACNELYIKDVDSFYVMISDDAAGEFYKKCGFKADEEDEDEMWLSKEKYQQFLNKFHEKSLVAGKMPLSQFVLFEKPDEVPADEPAAPSGQVKPPKSGPYHSL